MRILVCLLALLLVASCVSTQSSSTPLSDGTTAHVVRCEKGWTDCYASAGRICGAGGYTELDRVADGAMSTAGRLERRHSIDGGIDNHVYTESARDEVFQRVLAFRCDAPAESK